MVWQLSNNSGERKPGSPLPDEIELIVKDGITDKSITIGNLVPSCAYVRARVASEEADMSARRLLMALPFCLSCLAGCTFPVRQHVDELICDRAGPGHDLGGSNDADKVGVEKLPPYEQPKKKTLIERLEIPKSIEGADAKPIQYDKKDKDAVERVIKEHFPPVPQLEVDADFPLGPDGKALTLADLQKIAFTNSPVLRQAASDIQAARGVVQQAGLYPNPTFGYTASNAGPSGGPTFGVVMGQTVVTMGKLKVAQAAALMDLNMTELAYRRAETDLLTNVRTNYYGVLVAQESIRANRGLVELTDEVYRVMVDQLRGGIVATYEPLQLAVFSKQARASLFQARNARMLAWKQLASAMGVPQMPTTAVAGKINIPAPRLDYGKALAHVLTKHTDVLTTDSAIEKARHNLRLAQASAYPDVTFQGVLQDDTTPPGPSRVIFTAQATVPVPIYNRNQGNIRSAQAALVRASEEPHRVRADLTARFSEAFRRYEENRVLLEMYRKDILPKQVQAFRAAVKRHFGEAQGVSFNDLVQSEQTLVTVIGNYLPVLQAQWQAVVDVSSFLQTDQLYQAADEVNGEPDLNWDELLHLPCHHPCAVPVQAPCREPLPVTPITRQVPLDDPQGEPVRLPDLHSTTLPAAPAIANLAPPTEGEVAASHVLSPRFTPIRRAELLAPAQTDGR
jgi:cobalt-zinc-cadmium efflux system outer membrane protein